MCSFTRLRLDHGVSSLVWGCALQTSPPSPMLKTMDDATELKNMYILDASNVLKKLYEDYKDKGLVSLYLWGSITRDDWKPGVSDIDSLAIVDRSVDPDFAATLKERVKYEFPHAIKFGIQLFGIEELHGEAPYTTLARYQPAGYLLLRFNDWIHVAGEKFNRSDFTVEDFTAQEARTHQLNQAVHALKIVSGELPIDPARSSGMQSMVQDVVKGAIGALYWEAVESGYSERLNYALLPNILAKDRQRLATRLVEIRETNAYVPESVLALRDEIESL